MSLEKIYASDVITVTRDQTIPEVAVLMRDHSIGNVIVVDEGKVPIGLLTDRDIVVGALAEKVDDFHSLKVSDVMSSEIVCAKMDEVPYDIAMKMRDNGVSRMPVVDNDGKLCGVVTSNHIFRLINSELSALAGISDHHREATPAVSSGTAKPMTNTDMPNLNQPILQ